METGWYPQLRPHQGGLWPQSMTSAAEKYTEWASRSSGISKNKKQSYEYELLPPEKSGAYISPNKLENISNWHMTATQPDNNSITIWQFENGHDQC